MKTYTESELQEKFKSAIFNTLVVYNKESFHHTWRFIKNILEELSIGQLGDDVTKDLFALNDENETKLRKLWYQRNPCHENNADDGKDMFWGTVLCVMRDYVTSVRQDSSSIGDAPVDRGNSIKQLEADVTIYKDRYEAMREHLRSQVETIVELRALNKTMYTLMVNGEMRGAIKENESLLEYAKAHMDERAVMVISDRIKNLNEHLLNSDKNAPVSDTTESDSSNSADNQINQTK